MTVSSHVQLFSAPSELVACLLDPEIRLRYVTRQLEKCADCNNGVLPDRVVNAASRIMCGDNWCRHALRSIVLRGPSKYVTTEILLERVKPLRLDLVGYIYFADSPLRPSALKIGFTTRIPEVRVRSLMANSGEKLVLIGSFVGTSMDEQILHCINDGCRIIGEWFTSPRWFPPEPIPPLRILDRTTYPDAAMENARHDH